MGFRVKGPSKINRSYPKEPCCCMSYGLQSILARYLHGPGPVTFLLCKDYVLGGNVCFFLFFLPPFQAIVCALRNPKSPRTQNNRASGPKFHYINGIWALKPCYLGPRTLNPQYSRIWALKPYYLGPRTLNP